MTSEAIARPAGGATVHFALEHNCFACGLLNTHGLQLDLHVADDRCWTELTLRRDFQGWEGIAHGGIVTTVLDEVMAWSLVSRDSWGVTARMTLDFRRPVPIGRPVLAEGWVVDANRRLARTAARLLDVRTGEELAAAQGTYVHASDDRKRELKERYGFRLIVDPARETDAVEDAEATGRADPPVMVDAARNRRRQSRGDS